MFVVLISAELSGTIVLDMDALLFGLSDLGVFKIICGLFGVDFIPCDLGAFKIMVDVYCVSLFVAVAFGFMFDAISIAPYSGLTGCVY